jgi:MFS family permease
MPIVILSPNVFFLFCLTPTVGALWGGMNVSMNTQASEIERARGKPTMSTFHAGASLGMLAGATIGGLLIGGGWGNGSGAIGVAAVSLVILAIVIPNLLRSPPAARGPAFVVPSRTILGLGLLAFLMFMIEGGVADWSALFLATEKNASPGWAAAGFAVFTGAMAAFRVFGNPIVAALGRRGTIAIGGGLVAFGILFAILAPWPLLSALGFAFAGMGAANIVPILISTAANTPGMAASIGVGAVTTLGLIGFLTGPPAIGFIANAFGLSAGISLLGVAGLIVAVAAILRTWQLARD